MKSVQIDIQLLENCTSCSACFNICPRGAIFMQEDKSGFVYPFIDETKCINCGLCKQVCERIKKINKNACKETYALQGKDYSFIQKSSSGGMFVELAKYVLSKNGIVFGCLMKKRDNQFKIKHIYIEKEEELSELQGSKYVQSEIGYCYKQAKIFLDQNRIVLFSGTPCQIAGLKGYLDKDYQNLLCVDLSCTGVPSNKLFNDYIKSLEEKFNKKIKHFEFRNKTRLGWNCENAIVYFNDDTSVILNNANQVYLSLFLKGDIQRRSCYTCNYAGLKRMGDITLADCWGIEEEYPELLSQLDKKRGISLVLINTAKGQNFFNSVKQNIKFTSVNINIMSKYNHPLLHPTRQNNSKYMKKYEQVGYKELEKLFNKNLGFKRYYYILKRYTPQFIKVLIKKLLKNQTKIDCLLMTAYGCPNYGSLLTAYALQKTLWNLGYNSKIIDYLNYFGFGKKFIKKYLTLTKKCITPKDFVKLNNQTDTFIVGSDYLLNLKIVPFVNMARNLLNFTNQDKKRLMISGSIGDWDGSVNSKEEFEYIKSLLKQFDYVSTREEYGKEVFEQKYNCNADWINDPVFYLKKADYNLFIDKVKNDYSDSIMKYVLYPTNKTEEIVKYYSKKMSIPINTFEGNLNVKYYRREKNISVENWLSAIKHSKLIITDSFHCICFALIFNKPFICIKNIHATIRFTSLFKRLNLNIKLVESIEDLKNYSLDYDTNMVNQALIDIRLNALTKIEKNMSKEKVITLENNKEFEEFSKINKKYLFTKEVWYKKNKIIYIFIIKLIVLPIKRLINDFK